MNENTNDLTFFLEDGRKAEKKVMQLAVDNEEQKIVTELWTEPKIEKKLSQRIVSYKKPLVYKREIETIDENTGDVLEKQVESLDSDVKVQYREVTKEPTVSSLSYEPSNIDTSAFVTKEDLKGALAETTMSLVRAIKDSQPKKTAQSLNYQEIIKEKVENSDDVKGWGAWAILAALGAVFVYVTFFL